ncbi:uncharacterized protein zgc:158868 isoform X2 [Pseudoliparis swirei]|nr:uncharacterized protein zgc:158868 isoform X2 [Pseudoliparis swirei]
MSDEDSISAAVQAVSRQIDAGGLNLLINNAAINQPAAPALLAATGKKDMMDVYETNVVGPFLLAKMFLPLLKRAAEMGSPEEDSVVSLSSVCHNAHVCLRERDDVLQEVGHHQPLVDLLVHAQMPRDLCSRSDVPVQGQQGSTEHGDALSIRRLQEAQHLGDGHPPGLGPHADGRSPGRPLHRGQRARHAGRHDVARQQGRRDARGLAGQHHPLVVVQPGPPDPDHEDLHRGAGPFCLRKCDCKNTIKITHFERNMFLKSSRFILLLLGEL